MAGKIGESAIAKWFQKKGYNVLPVYEKEIHEGKGPTLFSAHGEQIICPDMLVFKQGKIFFAEAKHKSAFTWHRITKRWVTGIDLRHYFDYLKIQNNSYGIDVNLLFLHREGVAKDTPQGMFSPTGLFGRSLDFLKNNENHRHENWGKTGMVYWSRESLNLLAELREVLNKG